MQFEVDDDESAINLAEFTPFLSDESTSRSERPEKGKCSEAIPSSGRFDVLFFKRLSRIFFTQLGVVSVWQILLILLLIVLSIIQALIGIFIARSLGNLTGLFQSLDMKVPQTVDGVWNALLQLFLLQCGDFACSLFLVRGGLLQYYFFYLWRKHLTLNLLKRYFQRRNYYLILQLHDTKIDNPDQRIDHDAAKFCEMMSRIFVSAVQSIVLIIANIVYLIQSGYYWVLVPVLIWPVLNTIAYGILLTPLSSQIFKRDEKEGDFRYFHARIRENAEAMAFYESEDAEKRALNASYHNLWEAMIGLSWRSFFFSLWTQTALSSSMPSVGRKICIFLLVFLKGDPFSSTLSQAARADLIIKIGVVATNMDSAMVELFRITGPLTYVIGNTARVAQLFEMFDDIDQDLTPKGEMLYSEHEIVFEHVNIRVPSADASLGRNLVSDVSFKLQKGDHLMIMGASGTGKSSLLRVLAGLWDFNEGGKITRPQDVPEQIFFLSQRPYLVEGSLCQNVTYPYPAGVDETVMSEEYVRLFEKANLGYLVTRHSLNENDIVNWDDRLSIGEQQRLGIVRCLYHHPLFCIMDEATSALDAKSEEMCYKALIEAGITIISIGHRKSLMRFHKRLLTVEEGQKYTLQDIDESMLPVREIFMYSMVGEYNATEEDKRANSYPRHEVPRKGADSSDSALNWLFVKRLIRLFFCQIAVTSPCHHPFIVLQIVFVIIATALYGIPKLIESGWTAYLVVLDENNALIYTAISALTTTMLVVVWAFVYIFQVLLGIYLRTNLTHYFHDRLLRRRMFYKLNVLDGQSIDNVDQRICQDANVLLSSFDVRDLGFTKPSSIPSFLTDVIVRLTAVIVNVSGAGFSVGWLVPVVLLVIFAVTAFVQYFFILVVAKLRYMQQQKEGYFRNSLVRLRVYAEPIAFFNGVEWEKRSVKKKFKALLRNQFWFYMIQALNFWLVDVGTKLGIVVSYVIFFGSIYLNPKEFEGLTKESVVALIVLYTLFFQNAITEWLGLLSNGNSISDVIGNTSRVCQLIEKMDELEGVKCRTSIKDLCSLQFGKLRETEIPSFNIVRSGRLSKDKDQRHMELSEVTLRVPDHSKTLFFNLSLSVELNETLLIKGPSGVGKSSLLRVLCGLWTSFSGDIFLPSSKIFFLPQRCYLILGTLRDQVTYPKTGHTSDDVIMEVLERVNLGYLFLGDHALTLDRVEKDWSTVLSPGEQQRIGLARLLVHKPIFAILDECTSALDEDNEKLFYDICIESGITFISVGHRVTLDSFHKRTLHFAADGSWKLLKKENGSKQEIQVIAEKI